MVSSLDFLTATDANRKKFLVSLLGLERYGEVLDNLKAHAAEQKQTETALSTKLDYISSNLVKANTQATKALSPTLTVPEVDNSLLEQAAVLESGLASIETKNKAILECKRQHALIQAREAAESKVGPFESDLLTPEAYKNQHSALTAKREVENAQLLKFKEQKTHCPTCGTAYEGNFEHRDVEIKRLTDSITKSTEEIAKIKLLHTKAAAKAGHEKAVAETAAMYAALDKTLLSEVAVSVTDTTQRVAQLRLQHKTQAAAAAKVEAENSAIGRENVAITIAKKTVMDLKADSVEVGSELESARSISNNLKILLDVFGTKGLITYKIESCVKVFEQLINTYLQKLSDGRFALEFTIEDTKLALKLYDNSQEIEINQLSSGEFNRVNTATLLAVRQMMSAISKTSINILFLDEVVSVLDKSGKDTLVNTLLEENLNCVMVSHGYTHPLTERITVVKKNGISELING
jgi:DNA repair exonuclease SbcCD ATPase subunit